MRYKTLLLSVAVAASAVADTSNASSAETSPEYYLMTRPGTAVQYIILNGSDRDATGYLASIRASGSASDAEVRSQTFVTHTGNSLSFGTSTAVRISDGYMLTSIASNGQIEQAHFVRSSLRAIDASVIDLSNSVSRNRKRKDLLAAKAALRTYSSISAEDSARLSKAQASIEAAAAQQSEAQRAADRLSAAAREARSNADAMIAKSGVSFAENKARSDAMKIADKAEQDAVVAQDLANVAEATVATARSEAAQLQAHIADIDARVRALAVRIQSNVVAGR